MTTQTDVDAYYAEIQAGKQRTPSKQEEAFVKKIRQEDERPDSDKPGLASGKEDTTHAKEHSTMQAIITTDAALTLAYGRAIDAYAAEAGREIERMILHLESLSTPGGPAQPARPAVPAAPQRPVRPQPAAPASGAARS